MTVFTVSLCMEEQLFKSHNDICVCNTAGKVLVGNVTNSVHIFYVYSMATNQLQSVHIH